MPIHTKNTKSKACQRNKIVLVNTTIRTNSNSAGRIKPTDLED